MKLQELGLGFLLFVCFYAPSTFAQGRPVSPPGQTGVVSPFGAAESGSIIVYVRGAEGQVFNTMPDVTISSTRNPLVSSMAGPYGSGVIFQGVPLGGYTVEARYPGFQVGTQSVELDFSGETQTVVIILRPVGDTGPSVPIIDSSIIPPRAQKDVQKALKQINPKRNYDSARKLLEKALRAAPNSSVVNYLLGMTYLWQRNVAAGLPYLEKAVQLDPNYGPALVSLGSVRLDKGDFEGAIRAATKAAKSEPKSWQAQWIMADAYLRRKEFEKAREHAANAVQLGKKQASGAQIVLGEALAALGKSEESANVLESYLQENPNVPDAANIRSFVSELRKSAAMPHEEAVPVDLHVGSPAARPMATIPLAPTALPPKVAWTPTDIDAESPSTEAGISCTLPNVLKRVGQRTEQLASSLQEFSATEEYQTAETGRNGQWGNPVSASFDYLVFIRQESPKMVDVQEKRQPLGAQSSSIGDLIDDGAPAMVFIFHPFFRDDFKMTCEGLGKWHGRPAWLVHFAQRPDRPRLIRSFEAHGVNYPLSLKGRAWISADSYQILHLETDLEKPVPEIELKKEHVALDYRPVFFKQHKVELWLPENVDIYLYLRNRYFHHYHHFTSYRLFWVGSSEKVEKPKQTD